MDKKRNQLEEIAKLSDIIRNKYKQIKYNKISSEDNAKDVFRPVVEPLQKLIDISNHVKVKNEQKNYKIKKQEDALLYKNDYDNDSDYNNFTFKSVDNKDDDSVFEDRSLFSTLNDHNISNVNVKTESTNQSVDNFENDQQQEYDESTDDPLSKKIETLIRQVENKSNSLDLVFGVRKLKNGLFFGDKPVQFVSNTLNIADKSYPLTEELLELLFKKEPQGEIPSQAYEIFKEIVLLSNAHRTNYKPYGTLRINNSKFNDHFSFLLSNTGNGLFNYNSNAVRKNLSDYMLYNDNKIDYVHWNDPNELVDRLRLLIASQTAGNTSHSNEIISIIEELREARIIY